MEQRARARTGGTKGTGARTGRTEGRNTNTWSRGKEHEHAEQRIGARTSGTERRSTNKWSRGEEHEHVEQKGETQTDKAEGRNLTSQNTTRYERREDALPLLYLASRLLTLPSASYFKKGISRSFHSEEGDCTALHATREARLLKAISLLSKDKAKPNTHTQTHRANERASVLSGLILEERIELNLRFQLHAHVASSGALFLSANKSENGKHAQYVPSGCCN